MVSVSQTWGDNEARFVCVKLRFRSVCFRTSSVYALNMNPERNDFLKAILPLFDPLSANVIGGDFNSVPDISRDHLGGNPSEHYNSTVGLQRLVRSSSTVDVWRAVHPNVQAFTWSNRSSTISSRIDLMFCHVNWLSCVSSSHIIPCPLWRPITAKIHSSQH